jgi:heme/copper-type cytochrome/quinol oxidase subunit 2
MTRLLGAMTGVVLAIEAASFGVNGLQDRPPAGPRSITIDANQCVFTPSHIDVDLGARVRLTVVAVDSPHSFVIDAYRIMKLAAPDHPATTKFVADQAGTFAYFSSLSSDSGCPNMRGEMAVR